MIKIEALYLCVLCEPSQRIFKKNKKQKKEKWGLLVKNDENGSPSRSLIGKEKIKSSTYLIYYQKSKVD